jgi:putative transposase
VHVLISIPPKYSVSQVVGFIKGKSAISIARNYMGAGRISQVRVFGRGDIMFQQLEGMKKLSEITFVTKKQKIVE